MYDGVWRIHERVIPDLHQDDIDGVRVGNHKRGTGRIIPVLVETLFMREPNTKFAHHVEKLLRGLA